MTMRATVPQLYLFDHFCGIQVCCKFLCVGMNLMAFCKLLLLPLLIRLRSSAHSVCLSVCHSVSRLVKK